MIVWDMKPGDTAHFVNFCCWSVVMADASVEE